MSECNYTGWNHRVMRKVFPCPDKKYPDSILYSIHEVYYNQDGSVATYTLDEVRPCGESLEELKEELQLFLKALEQPVLEYGVE